MNYKAGDRVRVVGPLSNKGDAPYETIGCKGRIRQLGGFDKYRYEIYLPDMDDFWYYTKDQLELIEEYEPGEMVEVSWDGEGWCEQEYIATHNNKHWCVNPLHSCGANGWTHIRKLKPEPVIKIAISVDDKEVESFNVDKDTLEKIKGVKG